MPFISFIGFCIGNIFFFLFSIQYFRHLSFPSFIRHSRIGHYCIFYGYRATAKLFISRSLLFNSIFFFVKRHPQLIQEYPPESIFLCFRSAFRLRCVQSLCDRCGFPTLADQPIGSLLTSCFGSSRTKKQSLLQIFRFQEKDKTNLSHDGLNPAHVRF